MEVELLSLGLDFTFSLFLGEEVEGQKKDKMSQLWEEELDYVREGRISIFTLPRPVLYGHGRTEKSFSPYRDGAGSRRNVCVKLLHITCKFDFSLNF